MSIRITVWITGAAADRHAHRTPSLADFQATFLALTLPILILSPMLQKLLGLSEAVRFSGDLFVLFAFSTYRTIV